MSLTGALSRPPAAARRPSLFDSHAHLTDAQFADDVSAVLARAADAGVREILVPATAPGEAGRAADIAALGGVPRIVWSAGLHPHAADAWDPGVARTIAAEARVGAVAVGETGLDYHYENAPRPRQREAFAAQAELARALDLPLIVHSREAEADTLAILRASGLAAERVILHCFSSSPALFEPALEEGYYVSFSGLITFRRYSTPVFPAAVPAERLLIETDAPYLAPVPYRGRRNEPAFLSATLAHLAVARDADEAELAALTRANARRAYKLEEAV